VGNRIKKASGKSPVGSRSVLDNPAKVGILVFPAHCSLFTEAFK
jgi:hypothetical protein